MEEGNQTLLPAEVTTAKEPVAAPFASLTAKKEDEEEAIDADAVFAKLKTLKPRE